MIFVTVGTQLPFDRLLSLVDNWASGREQEIIAQTGSTKVFYSNITAVDNFSPDRFSEIFGKADLIVSHAGMGTVINALSQRKPIIIFPRRASLAEHRNDHQLATAKWLSTHSGVTVAFEESELLALLNDQKLVKQPVGISNFADEMLINNLKRFIWNS